MAIFLSKAPDGRVVLISAPKGDEATARMLAAGKGAAKDDRYLDHSYAEVSQLDSDGQNKVLWDSAAAAPAKAEKFTAEHPTTEHMTAEHGKDEA